MQKQSPDYVAYTIEGKGLKEYEYKNFVLDICEDTDNDNYLTHDEVFRKFENRDQF